MFDALAVVAAAGYVVAAFGFAGLGVAILVRGSWYGSYIDYIDREANRMRDGKWWRRLWRDPDRWARLRRTRVLSGLVLAVGGAGMGARTRSGCSQS